VCIMGDEDAISFWTSPLVKETVNSSSFICRPGTVNDVASNAVDTKESSAYLAKARASHDDLHWLRGTFTKETFEAEFGDDGGQRDELSYEDDPRIEVDSTLLEAEKTVLIIVKLPGEDPRTLDVEVSPLAAILRSRRYKSRVWLPQGTTAFVTKATEMFWSNDRQEFSFRISVTKIVTKFIPNDRIRMN